ncbi:MAG: hypothetical protein ABIW84_05185 [Ilumatobacteraceae bacterium]
MNIAAIIGRLVIEVPHQDSEGITTHSPIFPEQAEIIYGGIASIIIFALLYKFAGPAIRKGMAARTERIQNELDSAAVDKADADTEAVGIRQAKGDISAERDRLMVEADAHAEALLVDGRIRLAAEFDELKARAAADIESGRNRWADELRAEIAGLSTAAADRAVAATLDDTTQQGLIEAFIQKVGAPS